MVLMRGNKRVFETPNIETSSSGSVRTVNIYGVTSYNDIIDCIIPIKSNASGFSGTNTLNINNLGAENIKLFKNGSKIAIDFNWISMGQIYYVYYDGTDFILLNASSDSGGSSHQETFIFNITLSNLAAGTYTQVQMDSIIDLDFYTYIGEYGIILHDISSGNRTFELLNTSNVFDSVANTNTYKFSILNGTDLVEYTIVLDIQNETYTVTINTIDLSLRNGNNIYF